jgi:hypothetical protein
MRRKSRTKWLLFALSLVALWMLTHRHHHYHRHTGEAISGYGECDWHCQSGVQ